MGGTGVQPGIEYTLQLFMLKIWRGNYSRDRFHRKSGVFGECLGFDSYQTLEECFEELFGKIACDALVERNLCSLNYSCRPSNRV